MVKPSSQNKFDNNTADDSGKMRLMNHVLFWMLVPGSKL